MSTTYSPNAPGPGNVRLVSEERGEQKVVSNGVLGMILFILTEIMLFSGMISAFSIVRASALVWPPPDQPRLPIEETAFNTAALFASGLCLYLAQRRFSVDRASARTPLIAAIALGTFFVLFQGWEWASMLAQGLTLTSSTLGSFFYLIVGSHGIHAVGALAALMWTYDRLNKDVLRSTQLATVSAFWYFVVLVWPILYWQVYL